MSEVEASFRQESARLVSLLVRAFGPSRLQLAEDVVQETFLRALKSWAVNGPPPNRGAWLTRVAKNLAVDALRREGVYAADGQLRLEQAFISTFDPSTLDDAELEMLFLCCHPAIAQETQIALILRELCGLSTKEIAKALLVKEDAVAQRLVRGKRALAGEPLDCEPDQLHERLETVLSAIYLLFNEGYSAHSDAALTRSELCDDAILLTQRLSKTSVGDRPETQALLALMWFHSSRLPARLSAEGAALLLEDQDRSLWDQARIGAGLRCLAASASGAQISRFHFEAGIAAEHALAESYEATRWTRVLESYDGLAALLPTPVVLLNRAVPLAMVNGPEVGLKQIEEIEEAKELQSYHLLPSMKGRLLEMLERPEEARVQYEKALALAVNPAEQKLLRRRLVAVGSPSPGSAEPFPLRSIS